MSERRAAPTWRQTPSIQRPAAMSLHKNYDGYTSFSYLDAGTDYPAFELAPQIDRVPPRPVPLGPDEEARVEALVERCVFVSLHEHLGVFPKRIEETPDYVRHGRMATAFEGLAASYWDCVFDNLMDGICTIHSRSGWQWDDVLHDLGMRLCDLAHQDFVTHCLRVSDIQRAHDEGRVALVASMEGAAMIEHELDRIDLLYGFGVRALGITYSESNALGNGLKEARDGGLTVFGKRAVERMNKVGMLIDCSHCGDQTTLDTIEWSEKPIVLSHIGARALWDSNRLAPDEVLEACAAKGGVIGVEAAPHTTLTPTHRTHGLDAFMEHFQYIESLVGIDHVGFGPDTLYGDHVGLHRVYSANLSLKESRGGAEPGKDYHPVEYVAGLENPTEGSTNIVRWLVKEGYDDDAIEKVMGGNALRLMSEVWG
ncbi:MAG: membrane dipeptidase [Longimicrobiales bacterium]